METERSLATTLILTSLLAPGLMPHIDAQEPDPITWSANNFDCGPRYTISGQTPSIEITSSQTPTVNITLRKTEALNSQEIMINPVATMTLFNAIYNTLNYKLGITTESSGVEIIATDFLPDARIGQFTKKKDGQAEIQIALQDLVESGMIAYSGNVNRINDSITSTLGDEFANSILFGQIPGGEIEEEKWSFSIKVALEVILQGKTYQDYQFVLTAEDLLYYGYRPEFENQYPNDLGEEAFNILASEILPITDCPLMLFGSST